MRKDSGLSLSTDCGVFSKSNEHHLASETYSDDKGLR